MPWQLPVVLRVLVAHVLASFLKKKIVGLPSRTRRFTWQFGLCLLFSILLLIYTKDPITVELFFISIIGFIFSFSCYCNWRAVDVSQSKTALFTQADDIIAIGLGMVFLSEWKTMHLYACTGLMICIIASVLISIRKSKTDDEAIKWKKLLIWISGYSVIWGISVFFMRIFALKGVSIAQFLFAFYAGGFFGSIIVRAIAGKREQGTKLDSKGIIGVIIFSIVIWVALVLAFKAKELAPISVVEPIFMITEMVFPALIGLFVFKEKDTLGKYGKILFAIAGVGVVILAVLY